MEKAEAFKTFFSSVFTCEDQKCLGGLEEELRSTRSEVEIGKVVVTVREVYEELCKIDPSKAAGPDGIPSRLIREGAPWIAEPLYIFNTSLQSGQPPQDWTRANDAPKNYRQVSLTSLTVKVMERLIQRRIMNFLTDNDKLNLFQHGFHCAHSCQAPLLETVNQWARSLDRGISSRHLLRLCKSFRLGST